MLFTIIGAVIGIIIGLITVITNIVVLFTLPLFSLLSVYRIIMFSYLVLGAFSGIVIDLIIKKTK